jgi:hypothetical protein
MVEGDLFIIYMGHSSLDHFFLKENEIYQVNLTLFITTISLEISLVPKLKDEIFQI